MFIQWNYEVLMQLDKNTVYVNQSNVIEIVVCGDQTVESVQQLGDEALRLAAIQRDKHHPALILDNLLQIGSVPPEARKRVVDLIKSTDYNKLAMVGASPMIRFGANLMLQATGKGGRVKYFDSYDAALAWLKA
jgi:hypothetical protein